MTGRVYKGNQYGWEAMTNPWVQRQILWKILAGGPAGLNAKERNLAVTIIENLLEELDPNGPHEPVSAAEQPQPIGHVNPDVWH